MKSMPAAGAAADVKSGGPREQLAIASLKQRKLGVSADQPRRSSFAGNAADVQALLDAGVNVNRLYFAVFSGCAGKHGESEGNVDTVEVLLAAGANVKRKTTTATTS